MLIAKGSEPAFRKVFDRYRHKVYQFIFLILESEVETEELTQEVFLRIWERREKLEKIENPDGYLFIMSKNLALTALRQKSNEQSKREQWSKSLHDNHIFQDNIYLQESQQLLEKAIIKLPKQQQLIYRLAKEEQLSRTEIAQKLGLSENTVRNHLTAAVQSIRMWIRQQGGLVLLWLLWQQL